MPVKDLTLGRSGDNFTHCNRRKESFPGGSVVKNPSANAGDTSFIPGLGGSPGVGRGNPFQYSCLENPMDSGTRKVQGVAKSWTQLEAP